MIPERKQWASLLHDPHHAVLMVESSLPWSVHQPGPQGTLMSKALLTSSRHMACGLINRCWLSHCDEGLVCYLSISSPSWLLMKMISHERSEETGVSLLETWGESKPGATYYKTLKQKCMRCLRMKCLRSRPRDKDLNGRNLFGSESQKHWDGGEGVRQGRGEDIIGRVFSWVVTQELSPPGDIWEVSELFPWGVDLPTLAIDWGCSQSYRSCPCQGASGLKWDGEGQGLWARHKHPLQTARRLKKQHIYV